MSNIDEMDSRRDYFQAVKGAFAPNPKKVDAQRATRTAQYRRWCFRHIFAMFDLTLPKTWDTSYFKQELYRGAGLMCVSDTPLGVLPIRAEASGINVWLQPTTMIIANPVIGSFEKTIDVDCVPLFLDEDCLQGLVNPLLGIVLYYSEILADIDAAMSVNLLNSRTAYVIEAGDKNEAKTFRAVMDQVYQGEPAVFTRNGVSRGITPLAVKNNYISDSLQELKRQVKEDFLSEVGVNNANFTKKARLNVEEVESNNEEVISSIAYFYETLAGQFEKVRKMFGYSRNELNVSMHDWKIADNADVTEIDEDAESEDMEE